MCFFCFLESFSRVCSGVSRCVVVVQFGFYHVLPVVGMFYDDVFDFHAALAEGSATMCSIER